MENETKLQIGMLSLTLLLAGTACVLLRALNEKLHQYSLENRTIIQSRALDFNGDSIPETVYFNKGKQNYAIVRTKDNKNAYASGPVVNQDGIPFIQVDGGFYDMNGRYFSNKPEVEKK